MSKNKLIPSAHHIEEDEINLVGLLKSIWEERKAIIKTTLIFMCIGLFVAIFSKKEYTASVTMIPQSSDGINIGGNLGGLAAMAGINLGNMGGDSGVSPTLYPQIINSIPFQKELLKTSLTIEGQSNKVTYKEYYTNVYSSGVLGFLKKYTIGLPGIIIKALKGKPKTYQELINNTQLISITEDEKELIEQLSKQLILEVNDKDGYVTLAVNMPEAMASAELTKNAQELLQQYIISFKIQKSSEQLKFIEQRYREKKEEFEKVQQKLAHFRDRNQYVTTSLAQTNIEQLQSEYDLTHSVYIELAKQLETQQIQVKEDTPVFTIIKDVTIPYEKSSPNRPLILVIWTFFGCLLGVGRVFAEEFLNGIKVKWNSI